MKDALEGKPLGHPLHPFLVHFPIGLFVVSLVLDVAARVWPGVSGLSESAFYSMAAGVILALVAAIPGFVDYTGIRRDHPARKIAVTHMLLNLLVVGLYAANLGLRKFQGPGAANSIVPLLLSITAMALLSVSGHLGGKLVFDNGISVGRHRRKTKAPEQTLKITAAPDSEKNGWVKIARESAVREGETLRVDFNGVIITIARSKGNLFAFQEFCTHRFGPLSEGCIRDGEITCPWHRSRFDMRTGEVTQGPAKEKLKTWEIRIQEGEIWMSPSPKS